MSVSSILSSFPKSALNSVRDANGHFQPYPDDTNTFDSAKQLHTLHKKMQPTINHIETFCKSKRITINAGKTQELIITNKTT